MNIVKLLNKKLINNDKYIVDKILSYLDGICYKCKSYNLSEDLNRVYVANDCSKTKLFCFNCYKDMDLCIICNHYHSFQLKNNVCNYCSKSNYILR